MAFNILIGLLLLPVFLAAVIFMSSTVYADTVATMLNNSGGKIVLTDKDCQSDSRQFMAYTTSNSVSTQFGCWFSDDSMVHITWESTGAFKSYALEDWNVNAEVAKRLKKKYPSNKNGI